MNEIKIFENANFGEIRTVIEEQGEPLFCLADVCNALGLRQGDVVQRLDDGLVSTQPILDSLGRTQNANFVNEDGLYDVILDSRKSEAKKFRKWVTSVVLPSIRKTGSYSTISQQPTLQDKLQAATWAADFLHLNDASKLMMVKSVLDPLGLPTPNYVESKGAHFSAHELLKKHNAGISPKKFNEILVRLGYLTEMERDASNGRRKKFKLITTKGEEYGENMVSPYNTNETQPHWYANKFLELLAIVKDRINE